MKFVDDDDDDDEAKLLEVDLKIFAIRELRNLFYHR